MTARTKNASINLTANILIGDISCISVFEKRNDVPLAINTNINKMLALVLFTVEINPPPAYRLSEVIIMILLK